MPQMMPYSWVTILILVLFILFMLMCFIYFLVLPKLKIFSTSHPNLNKWGWMW